MLCLSNGLPASISAYWSHPNIPASLQPTSTSTLFAASLDTSLQPASTPLPFQPASTHLPLFNLPQHPCLYDAICLHPCLYAICLKTPASMQSASRVNTPASLQPASTPLPLYNLPQHPCLFGTCHNTHASMQPSSTPLPLGNLPRTPLPLSTCLNTPASFNCLNTSVFLEPCLNISALLRPASKPYLFADSLNIPVSMPSASTSLPLQPALKPYLFAACLSYLPLSNLPRNPCLFFIMHQHPCPFAACF